MTTEQELASAKQQLDDSVRASYEKTSLGQRIKAGLTTGIIGGALVTPFLAAFDIGWNKWIHKRPWNHNVGIKSMLMDFGLGVGLIGTITALTEGDNNARRSVKRIQAAYTDAKNAESRLANENPTTIQTTGAEHTPLDPQAQTRQL